jgi:hypothetical protein
VKVLSGWGVGGMGDGALLMVLLKSPLPVIFDCNRQLPLCTTDSKDLREGVAALNKRSAIGKRREDRKNNANS